MELLEGIYAYSDDETYWYCEDCYCKVHSITQETLAKWVERTEIALIHEDTVQYEQYPGQIIPLKGLYCLYCHAELYAPMEVE